MKLDQVVLFLVAFCQIKSKFLCWFSKSLLLLQFSLLFPPFNSSGELSVVCIMLCPHLVLIRLSLRFLRKHLVLTWQKPPTTTKVVQLYIVVSGGRRTDITVFPVFLLYYHNLSPERRIDLPPRSLSFFIHSNEIWLPKVSQGLFWPVLILQKLFHVTLVYRIVYLRLLFLFPSLLPIHHLNWTGRFRSFL